MPEQQTKIDPVDIVRSAYSIACRRGEETNWDAFRERCKACLDEHPVTNQQMAAMRCELKRWLRTQAEAYASPDGRTEWGILGADQALLYRVGRHAAWQSLVRLPVEEQQMLLQEALEHIHALQADSEKA